MQRYNFHILSASVTVVISIALSLRLARGAIGFSTTLGMSS